MKARACATATAAAVGLMILMQSQPTKAESCYEASYGGTLHRWEGRDCEDKVPHTMPHTIPTTWPLPCCRRPLRIRARHFWRAVSRVREPYR